MTITLYPFQAEAVKTLMDRASYLLADDMGLGKTVTTLTEIQHTLGGGEVGSSRVLIVCPNSVKGVWEQHVKQMWPGTRCVVVGNTSHNDDVAKYLDGEPGVLIVHWDALRLLHRLPEVKWDAVIADEATAVKNRKAQRTKALKKLRTRYKRALTGTPMVNRPDDLWSILHWLFPKEFTSYWRFFKEWCKYRKDPKYGFYIFMGSKNEPELYELLKPRMVRRTKAEVLPDLPEKYWTKLTIELDPKQRRAYDDMKRDSLAIVEPDTPIMAPTALAQLTRLRQFADAYCTVDEFGSVSMTEPSPKLDAMMEQIEAIDGRPVVVFSMFKQMVRLADERLFRTKGIVYEVMVGDTPSEERTDIIKRFQAGEVQVLLCTIQTGGVGITLTAADTAIFLDRSWSPADNRQAEDRLHRIGQKSAVQIIHLNAVGTVDQIVEDKLKSKAKMFRDIIEGGDK